MDSFFYPLVRKIFGPKVALVIGLVAALLMSFHAVRFLRLTAAYTALRGHKGGITSLTISRDGKLLASGSSDGTARVWDLVTKQSVLTAGEGRSSVRALAFSPEGKLLAAAFDVENEPIRDKKGNVLGWGPRVKGPTGSNRVHVWEVATGKLQTTFTGSMSEVVGLVFADDGATLIGATRGEGIWFWDVATWKEQKKSIQSRSRYVDAIATSPDGKLLAAASGVNPGAGATTVEIWNLKNGKPQVTLKSESGVKTMAFLPDNSTLAGGKWDATFSVWDIATGQERWHSQKRTGYISCLVPSPDGKMLAVGDNEYIPLSESSGQLGLFDIATRKTLVAISPHRGSIAAIAFSPDRKTLITGGHHDKVIKLWDVQKLLRLWDWQKLLGQ